MEPYYNCYIYDYYEGLRSMSKIEQNGNSRICQSLELLWPWTEDEILDFNLNNLQIKQKTVSLHGSSDYLDT